MNNNSTIDLNTALRLTIPGTEKDVNWLLTHNVLEESKEEEALPLFSVGVKDGNTGLYDLR